MVDIEIRMREPWFNPTRFLIFIPDGRIVGFCWTKNHCELANQDPIGELNIIGGVFDESGKGV